MEGITGTAIGALLGFIFTSGQSGRNGGPAALDSTARHGRPAITRVVVKKASHTMALMDGERAVVSYKVALGPGGPGVKRREGDSVTPVGRYHIVHRARSRYHVFLRLDYPNAEDRARFAKAKAEGALPKGATIGGDVGIHGAPPQEEWKSVHKNFDWTLGCVAVDDAEIENVARLVPDGTIVDIEDE